MLINLYTELRLPIRQTQNLLKIKDMIIPTIFADTKLNNTDLTFRYITKKTRYEIVVVINPVKINLNIFIWQKLLTGTQYQKKMLVYYKLFYFRMPGLY
jgi:hypothetical protein